MAQENDAHLHEGRAAILAAITRTELERDDALVVLSQVARQLTTKTAVQAAAAAAGYEAFNFSFDKNLELYFDLRHGERDVAYIAKGWIDPGMRIAQTIALSKAPESGDPWLRELKEFCATNGIICSLTKRHGTIEVALECVLYSDGFNAATLGSSLDALRNCRRKVEAKQERALDSLIGPD